MGTPDTTVFVARRIETMHPANPEATAVAVRDGRVLAVGTLEECASWGDHRVDRSFDDKVLIPGFVEAHGHAMDGIVATLPYVGYHPYPLPDGTSAPGVRSTAELLTRLRELDAALPPGEVLLAGSFDPIFLPDEPRLTRDVLDRVSTTRPIYIRHASGHLATVNTAMLVAEGITRDCPTPGVARDADGEPNGELQEPAAMSLARSASRRLGELNADPSVLRMHGELCRNAGVTTSTELAGMFLMYPALAEVWHGIVDAPDFPARMVLYNLPGMPGRGADPEAAADALLALRDTDTPKLRNAGCKLLVDGSIQGFTAALRWPGYYRGVDHGQLLMAPEEVEAAVRAFHRRRLNVHMHCNGNAAVDLALGAVETVLAEDAWLDHRHVVQHAQLTTQDQYRRMARLGLGVNLFVNHCWYWGDQHHDVTVGPERARAMWACRTALREGVPLSFHTDSGVTPIGHLSTMWCAVNRRTPSGRVLGEHERITPEEALRAATLGAAFQLRMDREIGSIEAGKRADFAVLEASPLEVDPLDLRDIPIWGTVLGGDLHPAPGSA